MIRVLTILCIVATTLGFNAPSLKVSLNSTLKDGTTEFIELPQNSTYAAASGWVRMTRTDDPAGLESLELMCPETAREVCLFFDDTGYVAGLQIAFDEESNAKYEFACQRFTNWITTLNDTTMIYNTVQLYFVSNETLAKDAATRIAARNSSLLLQEDSIWVSGINGKLFEISTRASDITGDDSPFTEQQCIPGMGCHYFYNMTTNSECIGENMFPWFPIIDRDQFVGLGFQLSGPSNIIVMERNSYSWFEIARYPKEYKDPKDREFLVADRDGPVSMHIYFIDNPWFVRPEGLDKVPFFQ